MKITIRDDRVIEADGRGFFPLQARHIPVGATLETLAEAGFNCFRHLAFGGWRLEAQKLPDDLHGMKLCAYLYDRTNLRANPAHRDELTKAVAALRARPDLLAYENYNEPAWRPDAPAVVNQRAEDLATGFQRLKQLDPDHPVHQGHSCAGTVDALRQYNACADVVGCNPYPVLPAKMRQHIGIRPDGRALDSPDQTIAAVTDYTRKMVEVGAGRPVWMQLQAMAWEDFYGPGTIGGQPGRDPASVLYPSFEQMRYMAYADIIAGATGLLFSMYQVPADQPIWQDIRRLVRELSRRHDLLAGRTVEWPLRPRYRNLGHSIWKGVSLLAKQAGDQSYLLAANNTFDPAEVTWTGFENTEARALSELDEDRQVPIVNGAATDRFEPYAVHVYRIE